MRNQFVFSNPNPYSVLKEYSTCELILLLVLSGCGAMTIYGTRGILPPDLAHYLHFERRSCVSLIQYHSLGWTFGPWLISTPSTPSCTRVANSDETKAKVR